MGNKKVITFGEVMMRLSTPGYERFVQTNNFEIVFGGSEANVAVSLAGFGVKALHVTRFPSNDLGKAAAQSLQKYGVTTSHVLYGPERMGIYFVENGAMQRASRIIYDRFDSAFANIKPGMVNWDEIMQQASWFHWTGITPAISMGAAEVCAEALEAARRHGVATSGDINYRRNLWQYGKAPQDVMPALIAMTDRIVAGISDFENCLGISGETYEETCAAVCENYPNIQRIASTHRESVSSSHNNLCAVMWDGRQLLYSGSYQLVPIVDRVGAGDAFMAGLIYGWATGKAEQQTLDFAIAASAWKHSVPGDVNLAAVEEIEHLCKGENVGVLLR